MGNFGSFLGYFWVIFRPFFGANFLFAKYAFVLFKSLFASLQSAYLNAGEGVKLLFEFRFFPLTTRREVEAQVTEEM